LASRLRTYIYGRKNLKNKKSPLTGGLTINFCGIVFLTALSVKKKALLYHQ